MIVLVVALKDEARPFIEGLKLLHIPDIKEYKIYKNDEVTLIISGVGKIKSAIATTFILSKFPNPNGIINFGICGCGDLHLSVGEILLANKIVDEGTEKSYFSDIHFSHHLREFTIHTFEKPIENKAIGSIGVDMEASGFFQGALKFMKADKIFSVKIISDHLDTTGINSTFILDLIRKHFEEIKKFLEIFKEEKEKKIFSTLDKINLSSKKQ
ncbi:MAG: hypothetical protein OIF32_01075 [Campylobacterales bacterium]|nr:hypothetical protein [Campylobacterales bacterium]